MEHKTLNNGLKMPMVGLGVYNIPERGTQRIVEDAIYVGYRSIVTAAMYYNEKAVGDAVRACGVPREKLFITTKICDFIRLLPQHLSDMMYIVLSYIGESFRQSDEFRRDFKSPVP